MRHETDHQGSTSTRAQQAPQDHDLDAEHDPERARRVSTGLIEQDAKKRDGQTPTITVSAGGVFDLQSGNPRNQIAEAITWVSDRWTVMITNLTGAVEEFTRTVQHSQIRQAESGLMAALWGHVKPLLVQAATVISGTPLGAIVGMEAIDRIVKYGDALEQLRVQADQESFINQVRATKASLIQQGPFERAATLNDVVTQLDAQFRAIGKSNPDDEYKYGDHAVLGAQAAFLKELHNKSREYGIHIPTQEAFTAKFFQEWIVFHHKRRKRSAMRSPLDASTYQDGYIELDTTLLYDRAYSGWFIADGTFATAKLHCPKSHEVAEGLKQTVQPFNLDELDVPIVIELQVADDAWEHMPSHWKHQRDRRIHVRNGMVTAGAKDFWQWVLQQTKKSTREVLAGVETLEG